MPQITLNIKGTNETKFSFTLDPDTTSVLDLKGLIEAQDAEIPKDTQRLIYGGRILKDEEKLSTYKIQDASTVHLVKGKPKQQPAAAEPRQATTQAVPDASTTAP
ncbi:Deubiquitination-protection protein dph1, partial [Smittium mucronatum]